MLFVAPFLGSVLVGGCGDGDDEPATRDVYQSREECLSDWNDGELCSQMNDEERDYYDRDSGYNRGGVYFWGPLYYPSSRSVSYKGKTYSPASRSSSLKPFSVTSRAPSSSRTGVSSPRGGFGGKSSSGG